MKGDLPLMLMEQKEDKKGLGYFFDFSEVLKYYFRKKDPNRKPNSYIRMMHGINKFSIIVFILALLYMIYRYVFVY